MTVQYPATPPADARPDPRITWTPEFPRLLRALGSSLLVSTYQAGLVTCLRAEGDEIKAQYARFRWPMGLAVDQGRLAVGVATQVHVYHDVARSMGQPAKRGADCSFLPFWAQTTGNILIHELAWAGPELWIVSARFSCLCTLQKGFNFVPRWRPPFVTALAPLDHCHLNGLALRDGRPRYVTAHGISDQPAGWREHRAGGGVILDVDSGEPVARGLSMPHSPRWRNDRLWVLDSGRGALATVDLDSGQFEHAAALPGYTRGLDFDGPYAFIGLSQIRQSAVFSEIPLLSRLTERFCGIQAVDLRTGQIVGTIGFEDPVQEIFSVVVLPRTRAPEIVHDEKRIGECFLVPENAGSAQDRARSE